MPLDPALLSTQLRNAFLLNEGTQALDNPALTAVCDTLAQTILLHIATNAIVVPVAMIAPAGGGPVTGTGIIT